MGNRIKLKVKTENIGNFEAKTRCVIDIIEQYVKFKAERVFLHTEEGQEELVEGVNRIIASSGWIFDNEDVKGCVEWTHYENNTFDIHIVIRYSKEYFSETRELEVE